jgi:EmrB/QacA subfamily drug resistance transporter
MAAALSALDQTVVATALPHIIDSLQGATLLGWVFTAYLLGGTATVAVVGKLADLFGRQRLFLLGIGLFSVSSLLCGLATSMPMLVVFRGLQGIGAGAIQTCSLIVMADMFPPRQRAKWQVINSVGYATASAIGPSVGGVLSDNFSWRWIFLLNVPFCLATIALLLYGLKDIQRPTVRPRIDWAGGGLSIVTVTALLLACTWGGQEYAWISPQIASLVLLGSVGGALLYRVERRAAEPVIPGSLLRGNIPVLSAIAAAANSMLWFGLILLVPIRLQLVLGTTATVAGALLTPGIVLGPASSFVAGQILGRTGRYRVCSLLAGFFQVLGVGSLLFMPALSDQAWVIAGFMVACIGCGFGGPTFMIVYQNAIPHKQLGAGVGMFSLFRQLGASTGTALAGTLVGAAAAVASGPALAEAVQHAFALPMAAALAALAASIFMANRPLRSSLHDEDLAAVATLAAREAS